MMEPLRVMHSVIHTDPEISAEPGFSRAREFLFVTPLITCKAVYGLDEFLDEFTSVSRDQVIAILVLAHEVLTANARAPR